MFYIFCQSVVDQHVSSTWPGSQIWDISTTSMVKIEFLCFWGLPLTFNENRHFGAHIFQFVKLGDCPCLGDRSSELRKYFFMFFVSNNLRLFRTVQKWAQNSFSDHQEVRIFFSGSYSRIFFKPLRLWRSRMAPQIREPGHVSRVDQRIRG